MSKYPKVNWKEQMAERLGEFGYVSYSQYLNSPHWQDVRVRYWKSKLPKCCHGCGAANTQLELHHRTYKRLCAERLNDLVLVCRECHSEIHQYERSTSVHMWRSTNRVLRRKRRDAKRKAS